MNKVYIISGEYERLRDEFSRGKILNAGRYTQYHIEDSEGRNMGRNGRFVWGHKARFDSKESAIKKVQKHYGNSYEIVV